MSIKEFIKNLPLDDISQIVDDVVVWWRETIKDVPVDDLSFQVYVTGSLLACLLWFFVTRILPKPIGGMSWVILTAILFTPGGSIDDSGDIAPAIIGVLYSILVKDFPLAATKVLPILVVIIAGFFLGFLWQLIQDAIIKLRYEKALKKQHLLTANEANWSSDDQKNTVNAADIKKASITVTSKADLNNDAIKDKEKATKVKELLSKLKKNKFKK